MKEIIIVLFATCGSLDSTGGTSCSGPLPPQIEFNSMDTCKEALSHIKQGKDNIYYSCGVEPNRWR